MSKRFDVFLSHNSKDKPAVRALAEALQERGLVVWLDEWELVPGRPWQEALEEVIETTAASAVLVGKDGLGPWQDREMRGCLSEFVNRNLPVIPVLLPGAPAGPALPMFLKGFTWVDLREGLTDEGISRLEWGITGRRPDRSKGPSTPPTTPEPAAKARPASPEPRPTPPAKAVQAAVAPNPPRSRPEQQSPRTKWPATPRALLLAAAKLTAVIALGVFLAQWLVRTKTEACVPGEQRTENGIAYIRICPGTFTMGSAADDPQAYPDERPAHQVTLSEFWIGKTEITNEQYRRFSRDHPGEAPLPATQVSWNEAKAACERFGGDLPTEAQWEYAARAGSRTAWSFGDDEKSLGKYAWYEGNLNGVPRAVGKKRPNAWGLYDMHSNVAEWVADWYGPYLGAAQTDPTGPSAGDLRVLRGGAFVNSPRGLRSAYRVGFVPEGRGGDVGFRCARGPRRQP